jgi:hypothetical protein
MEQNMKATCVDKPSKSPIVQSSPIPQEYESNDRRKKDRRNQVCKGFTQISIVGWICRRETVRRKDDRITFSE